MAGRKPHKVYVYDEEGIYICMFENMVEFRKVYYPKDTFKRPLFVHEELGVKYHYMEDLQLVATPQRSAGRDLLKRILAIHNSEFCKKEDNNVETRAIQVFNLKNELIAEFKSQRLVLKFMPHLNQSTLSRQLNIAKHVKTHNELGLFFKYKE
jgi:hypothetical protein